MIYLELLWAFLRVGIFSFGSAYGAIPIIRDIVVTENSWLTDEMFAYFIALSESTPGPIMVNMATYIGSGQAGALGALLATIGVVLPSFFIIIIIVTVLNNFIENEYVKAVLKAIRAGVIGLVLAMGITMVINNIFPNEGGVRLFDWRSLLLTGILLAVWYGYQHIKKKSLSPIALIIISAIMGIVTYSF